MGTTPRVSVVIPMYNAERTIGEAVDSVLAQTWPACEIIVVDNGSTDRSAAAVVGACPTARLLHEATRGPAAARNRGAAAASGEYLAFFDADDLMPRDRLSRQVQIIEAAAEIDLVFGQQRVFRDGDQPWLEAPGPAAGRFQAGPCVGAMLCRQSAFARVGPFQETLEAGEFIEWFARARDAGLRFAVSPSVVLYRRVHDGNLTRDERTVQAAYAQAIKCVLDRRRGA